MDDSVESHLLGYWLPEDVADEATLDRWNEDYRALPGSVLDRM